MSNRDLNCQILAFKENKYTDNPAYRDVLLLNGLDFSNYFVGAIPLSGTVAHSSAPSFVFSQGGETPPLLLHINCFWTETGNGYTITSHEKHPQSRSFGIESATKGLRGCTGLGVPPTFNVVYQVGI